mgnify:CR=1 FL=1
MVRIILLAIVALILLRLFSQLQQQPPAERKRLLIQYGFIGLVGIVGVMVATGRMHWLGGLIAGMIPVVKYGLGIGLRAFPFYQRWKQRKQAHPAKAHTTMSRAEALEVLGLEAGASAEEIVDAHCRLIQKLHPDRGGNDYLASRVNDAKSVLLG